MFVIAPKDLPLKTEQLLEGLAGLPTTVSTCYSACVTEPREVVLLDAEITETADQVKIGSNTSLIGKNSEARLTGVGV
jgi:pectate lyase